MKEGMDTVAIIVAAGVGERTGLSSPKQYVMLGNKAVLAHSYAAFLAHPSIDRIIVVIGRDQNAMARKALSPVASEPWLVTGGAARRESVMAALQAIEAEGGARKVLIHDAARPFVSSDMIGQLVTALVSNEGAIPALPVPDTLVKYDGVLGETVSRDHLYRVQTPQAFLFDVVMTAHRQWPADRDSTDDAQMVRDSGYAVTVIPGDQMLEKLTYPSDFARAEAMLAARRLPRTGSGYDVHRLVEGKPLWLCGVEISHTHGLSGHSDADVAIHALVDAILGALAEGDIGQHFPPSNPQWKGAASHQFLTFARGRVGARGGEITHADITIICESPKIGPHREAMRSRLAELLGIPISRVSVKATTTERIGFTGRGEGIAAQAVATILLPEL